MRELVIAEKLKCKSCKNGYEKHSSNLLQVCVHCNGMGSYLSEVDGGKVRQQMREILK